MPTLDELRRRFGAKEAEKEPEPYRLFAKPIWSNKEVSRWLGKLDVITAGKTPGGSGVYVVNLRFRHGKYSGRTCSELAQNEGRGYLRWYYCKAGQDEGIKSVLRWILKEDDATIRAKYDSVEHAEGQ